MEDLIVSILVQAVKENDKAFLSTKIARNMFDSIKTKNRLRIALRNGRVLF